jgi:hypothetical protein
VEDIPELGTLSWTDNCDGNGSVQGTEIRSAGCPLTIERTWEYSDACGNTTEARQTITIHDTEPPVFSEIPVNLEFTCIEEVPVMPPQSWTDNCGTNGISEGAQVTSGTCPLVITRTWTATDDCGNSTETQQIITVIDNINPILTCSEVTIVCGASLNPIEVGLPSIIENCELSGLFYQDIFIGPSCSEIGTINRNFLAIDDCGNRGFCTQIISLVDETLPSVTNPPSNIIIECTDPIPEHDPIFVDNCDPNLTISLSSSIIETPTGSITTRTWTATDDCGNSTSVEQVITRICAGFGNFSIHETDIFYSQNTMFYQNLQPQLKNYFKSLKHEEISHSSVLIPIFNVKTLELKRAITSDFNIGLTLSHWNTNSTIGPFQNSKNVLFPTIEVFQLHPTVQMQLPIKGFSVFGGANFSRINIDWETKLKFLQKNPNSRIVSSASPLIGFKFNKNIVAGSYLEMKITADYYRKSTNLYFEIQNRIKF